MFVFATIHITNRPSDPQRPATRGHSGQAIRTRVRPVRISAPSSHAVAVTPTPPLTLSPYIFLYSHSFTPVFLSFLNQSLFYNRTTPPACPQTSTPTQRSLTTTTTMRLSSAATLALAAAPAVVSAAKGSMGFSLGMQMPNGDCKSQSDYEADFDAIKEASGATIVRGYAVSECEGMGKNILSAAEKKGFKVVLGIWPDAKGSPSNDLNAILEVADKYKDNIYAVTVGSEHLYRKEFTGDQLKDIIVSVREKLPKGIKVGTADSWNKFYDGTANPILDSVDILLINAFAFWQGAGGANATSVYFDDMYKAITHIEKQVGGKDKIEIWNGETGWPTAGM